MLLSTLSFQIVTSYPIILLYPLILFVLYSILTPWHLGNSLLFTVSLSQLGCKFHESRNFPWSIHCYIQGLKQGLAHSRCSGNTGWVNRTQSLFYVANSCGKMILCHLTFLFLQRRSIRNTTAAFQGLLSLKHWPPSSSGGWNLPAAPISSLLVKD